MAEQYGIIQEKEPKFPIRRLLRVPHRDSSLIVSYPAFGPDYFLKNIEEMQKPYSHPLTGEKITFRKPSTSESISAASYKFEELVKPQILDPRWLQLGHFALTSEGAWANPPTDKDGKPIIDEKTLKPFLNGVEKTNGIYLLDNDFGFAPRETFGEGKQDSEKFAEGGLARLLEHTEKSSAPNLKEISSKKFYPNGVCVYGFDEVKEPVLRVAALLSSGIADTGWLYVNGYFGVGGWGYAFGVSDAGEASAQKF